MDPEAETLKLDISYFSDLLRFFNVLKFYFLHFGLETVEEAFFRNLTEAGHVVVLVEGRLVLLDLILVENFFLERSLICLNFLYFLLQESVKMPPELLKSQFLVQKRWKLILELDSFYFFLGIESWLWSVVGYFLDLFRLSFILL